MRQRNDGGGCGMWEGNDGGESGMSEEGGERARLRVE